MVLVISIGGGSVTFASEPGSTPFNIDGVLQFDSTIEQISEFGSGHSTLFVRYWVSPQRYHVAVVWSEPQTGRTAFPGYPPTLRIENSAAQFAISHDVIVELNQRFKKPIGLQSTFTNMYGDYSLPNIRYAENAFQRTRLFFQDVETGIHQTNAPLSALPRNIGALATIRSNDTLQSLKVFDFNGSQIGSVAYRHEGAGNNLRNVTARLFEQPVTLGLPGTGATVRYGNSEFNIKELTSIDRTKAQKIQVDYQAVAFGAHHIRLPKTVIVTSTENEVLRKADFRNFLKIADDEEQIRAAQKAFCGFDQFDHEYRELLVAHWGKPPSVIVGDDVLRAKKLIVHYVEQPLNGMAIGQQLRRLGILMDLCRMVGDAEKLIFYYETYLRALANHDLKETLLVGGQSAIETLMSWGRFQDADRMLNSWVREASTINRDIVCRFVSRQINNGFIWTSLRLLDACGGSESGDFEICALRAVALARLSQMFSKPDEEPRKNSTKMWISKSTSITEINILARDASEKARSLYKDLLVPTPKEVSLIEQLK